MDAIEMLSNEHALIRRYQDQLSLAVQRLENGQRPPREFFDKAVEFFRDFSDRCHHFKEEYLMFFRLSQKKKGGIDAQLDVLRFQHERSRSLISSVSNELYGYDSGELIAATSLLEHLAAYLALLRNHVHIEEHQLYPMSRQELTEEDLARLQVDFEKDRDRVGERYFENAQALVATMASILART